jgi:hypothetical protein
MTQERRSGTPASSNEAAERLRKPLGDLPNQRDGLPPGSLRELPPDPQGDENRDPPRPPMPPP